VKKDPDLGFFYRKNTTGYGCQFYSQRNVKLLRC